MPSKAGTGLCGPDVGGVVRQRTGVVVCSRPKFGKLRTVQPALAAARASERSPGGGIVSGGYTSGEPPVGCGPPPFPLVTATIHTIVTATATTANVISWEIRLRSDSDLLASERSGVIAAQALGPAPRTARAGPPRRVTRRRLGVPALVHDLGDLAGEPLRRQPQL